MPGRSFNSPDYRYGFNGKEKDDNGEFGLTTYDYGFRIYNPALGKFLSVDPLADSYPWYTPYQFAGNTPIQAIDLDGLEEYHYTRIVDENGNTTALVKTHEVDIVEWQWSWDTWSFEKKVNQRQEYVVHQEDVYYYQNGTAVSEAVYDESVTFDTYKEALNSTDKDFAFTDADAEKLVIQGMKNVAEEIIYRGKASGNNRRAFGSNKGKVTKGNQNSSDFVSNHAYNRHKYDASRTSSRSRTQYGKGLDVKDIRNQTINNPDAVVKHYDDNGTHYATTYKRTFDQNISTSDTPTRESRVVINHLDDSRSSQFPYFKKGETDGF